MVMAFIGLSLDPESFMSWTTNWYRLGFSDCIWAIDWYMACSPASCLTVLR